VFFCASEAHGHAIYDVFSLAIKTTVFTVCFGQRPVFELFSAKFHAQAFPWQT